MACLTMLSVGLLANQNWKVYGMKPPCPNVRNYPTYVTENSHEDINKDIRSPGEIRTQELPNTKPGLYAVHTSYYDSTLYNLSYIKHP
jgi:hypothetical protein